MLLITDFVYYLPIVTLIYLIVSAIAKLAIHRTRKLTSLWHLIAIGGITLLSAITANGFAAINSDPSYLPNGSDQNLVALFLIPFVYSVIIISFFRAVLSKEKRVEA